MLDNMLKVRAEQEKGECEMNWKPSKKNAVSGASNFCTVDDFGAKDELYIDIRFRQTNFWGHKNLMCQKRNL